MTAPLKRRRFQFSLLGMLVTVTVVAVSLSCVLALAPVVRFFQNPFAGMDGDVEFVELSGPAAKRRMDFAWPNSVNPQDVVSMSHKGAWTRDTGSSWAKLCLTPAAAKAWADQAHRWQEQDALSSDNTLEGIHRSFSSPIPLHNQTGPTPGWWLPSGEIRATEVMLWYDYGSGTARATYTSFNPEANTLWVYEYSCQHDKLWVQGTPPQGTPIQRPSAKAK